MHTYYKVVSQKDRDLEGPISISTNSTKFEDRQRAIDRAYERFIGMIIALGDPDDTKGWPPAINGVYDTELLVKHGHGGEWRGCNIETGLVRSLERKTIFLEGAIDVLRDAYVLCAEGNFTDAMHLFGKAAKIARDAADGDDVIAERAAAEALYCERMINRMSDRLRAR